MVRLIVTIVVLGMLASCATNMRHPQTRDEFVSMYNTSGMFNTVAHVTIARPVKAVVSDVSEYARKCLAVKRTRAANYQLKEVGGSTTYHPKIEAARPGVMALSVQEQYENQEKGLPPDGLYTFVAEFQGIGKNETKIGFYYIATRGTIADSLKQWADGNKNGCPTLKN
jgi:hypothetical protein